MATTGSALAAGTVAGGNGGNGRRGLRTKLAAGAAALGCAAVLAFGASTAGESARPPHLLGIQVVQPAAGGLDGGQAERMPVAPDGGNCAFGDAFGVPGEGCGVPTARVLVGTVAADVPGCVYADALGVPGEGCAPRR